MKEKTNKQKTTTMNQISIRIQERRVREGQCNRVLWDLGDEEKFFDSPLT